MSKLLIQGGAIRRHFEIDSEGGFGMYKKKRKMKK